MRKNLTERAEAIRGLQRSGKWDDVEDLITLATADKKPSIRLHAGAAVMEILLRSRLSDEKRVHIQTRLNHVDPAVNPGFMGVYAVLGDKTSVQRLIRMTRDVRGGVREGAVAALRRWTLSHKRLSDRSVKRAIVEAMTHRKATDDVKIGLARLIGEAGLVSLRSEVTKLNLIRGGDVIAESLERLDMTAATDARDGFWINDGRDAFQEEGAQAQRWLAVCGEASASIDGAIDLTKSRVIWAPPVGSTVSCRTLQRKGESWVERKDKHLASDAEALLEELAPEAARWVRLWLADMDGASARVLPLLLWRSGDSQGALQELEPMMSKAANDLKYWHGRVCLDAGQNKAAKKSLRTYLDKASKTAKHRVAAEELLAKL
jgi:hypothetical protein